MNVFKRATISVLKLLPHQVKIALFHLSFHLARSEFEKFSYEYAFAPNMRLGLAATAARGFIPSTIVDVGAFEGNWSRMVKQVWPSSQLFMIEPNLEKKESLLAVTRELDAILICELLGAENGREVQFYLMESGSSIMEERSAVPRSVENRQIRTLDSLLDKVEPPGLLKIDAQGYELEILKGASAILPNFEAVLLEVSTIEINKGAPLLHDVVAFMKDRGFVVYDTLEIHRRPLDKALNQVDLLFIREQSILIADKRHFA